MLGTMDPMEERAEVKRIGRKIVAASDPRELVLFDSMADSFLDDPSLAIASARGRDVPVGSGLGLTPDLVHGALMLAKLLVESIPGVILSEVARDVVDRRKERREESGPIGAGAQARGKRKKSRGRGEPGVQPLLSVEVGRRTDANPGLQATLFVSDLPFQVTVEQAARMLKFVQELVEHAEKAEGGEDGEDGEGKAAS